MPDLDLDLLTAACSAGGPSCLTSTTPLRPAGGQHAAIAPAKFTTRARDNGTYAYERRYLDGTLRHTVLVDSKQSQLNRVEAVLTQAIDDGVEPLTRMPRIRVTYGEDSYTDVVLSHRAFDAHIRAGTVDGVPVTRTEEYQAIRNASPANARALLDASPVTLVFGGWDASRKSGQGRWRSALVGEITGFLPVDGTSDHPEPSMRGGARVDPVGMQILLDGTAMRGIAGEQADEFSQKTIDEIARDATAADKAKERRSASRLGLGGIPPSLDALAGVSCDLIVRSHVLSFATLRQMRFGAGPAGDAACRALLAALALNGLARSDAELYLRANCDLVEAAPTAVTVDRRAGDVDTVSPLTVSQADALLEAALADADRLAGVEWSGVALDIVGNPAIRQGAVAEDSEASA